MKTSLLRLRFLGFGLVGQRLCGSSVLLLVLGRHEYLVPLSFASLPVRLTFRRPKRCATHPARLRYGERLLEAAHTADHAMGTAAPFNTGGARFLCVKVTFVARVRKPTTGKSKPAQGLSCSSCNGNVPVIASTVAQQQAQPELSRDKQESERD
jgi:hypothetical protein